MPLTVESEARARFDLNRTRDEFYETQTMPTRTWSFIILWYIFPWIVPYDCTDTIAKGSYVVYTVAKLSNNNKQKQILKGKYIVVFDKINI